MNTRSIRGRVFALVTALVCLSGAPAIAGEPVSTEKLTLRVGYPPVSPLWGFAVIHQEKLWKKYLPNVEVEVFASLTGMALVNNLIAGKTDIAYFADTPAIILASKADLMPTRLIAADVADHGGSAIVYVAKDSPIKSVRDLDGKRVSVPFGGYSHRFAEVLAAREGIEFKLVGQSPEVGLTNLRSGKVDAYIPWPPFGPLAVKNGFARELLDGTKYNFDVFRGVVVSQSFADKHPAVVIGWLRAQLDAQKIMRERPDYAAKLIHKEWESYGIPLDVIREGFAYEKFPEGITPEWRNVLIESAKFLKNHGFIKESVDVNRFIDDSYLEKAAAIPSQLDLPALSR
ncbi:MAG: ABC transporter substrate-binding protein [Burkholderiales bacterium]|nr:ABC transporter substrate-binding protein [Burkholderiales bacterium]